MVERDNARDGPDGGEDDSVAESLVSVDKGCESHATKGADYGCWRAEQIRSDAGEAERLYDRCAPRT